MAAAGFEPCEVDMVEFFIFIYNILLLNIKINIGSFCFEARKSKAVYKFCFSFEK